MIIMTILIVIRNDNDDDNHHTKKITLMRSKIMTKMMIIILIIMITLMRSKSASDIMPERAVVEAPLLLAGPMAARLNFVVGEVDALLRNHVLAAVVTVLPLPQIRSEK